MKRNEWLIVLLPLALVWYLDRITKVWAIDIEGSLNFGLLHFSLHHNPGAMLGLFADLPPLLRVVSLATGGAFLVCTYVLIQYLLPIKSLILRSGMSILLGGILGNVTDRIVWGHVVDFIIIGTASISTPVFNVADALQWAGYGLVIYAIFKEGEVIWPDYNARRKFWINPTFQLKYCYILLGVGFGISLIAMVYSYTYLRVTMLEFTGNNPQLQQKFLFPFVITFALISLGVSVGLFTVGKIMSHKIAGPIYAFEKYITEMMSMDPARLNDVAPFKLRSMDEFKHLEELAEKVRTNLAQRHPEQPTAVDIAAVKE